VFIRLVIIDRLALALISLTRVNLSVINRVSILCLLFSLAVTASFAQNTANLWVNSTGGSCTRAATPAAFNSSTACSSFSAAYSAASAGDTIYVKGGTYGAQTVPSRSLGSVYTTISAAPGETVNIGSVDINTNWVVVNGFNLGNNNFDVSSAGGVGVCTRSHVTISNNIMVGVKAGITGACGDTIQLIGNEISGTNVCSGGPEDSIQFNGAAGGGTWGEVPPTNMLIKNNYIHDMGAAFSGCQAHADGTQLAGCIHCVLDGNRYNNTDTSAVIIYSPGGNDNKLIDIVVQNNSVGNVRTGSHGISIGGARCQGGNNFVVQNNTFWTTNTHDLNCAQGSNDGVARNNVYAVNDGGFACTSQLNFSYNVFATNAAGCGSNVKKCSVSFADASHTAGNINLNSSDTCAKDSVPTAAGTYPATDQFGTARPQGSGVDAGAFEVASGGGGPTPPVPPTSIIISAR
jgi:hypothetical protein